MVNSEDNWINELENRINGSIEYSEAKSWTWLGVGGAPICNFIPNDIEDIENFFKIKPKSIPFRVFGAGSNILVSDGDLDCVFIKMKKIRSIAKQVEKDGRCLIVADAGILGSAVAMYSAECGLAGLEFVYTIPGTIGGLVKMNAGAHGSCMKDIVEWVTVVDSDFNIRKITDCNFSYRSSCIQKDWIVLQVGLNLKVGNPSEIRRKIWSFVQSRKKTQPSFGKMCGCFFKNPEVRPAWQLIRESCVKDFPHCKISDIHANFIMNSNEATANEMKEYIKYIQDCVFNKTGYKLELEVEIV